ncbi:MAG: acylneuraminate cytidylyltransferase family protein [Alphaproteobacteria bacterium]|nr:acylneuraminate cytidylyltransferase family protein [Alphaproteobacteria bacterium]
MKTFALIPARAGSKGVKNKNTRVLGGKPLIAHSIEVALACDAFDRVIVTTDSKDIADIAKRFGADVPFLRPSELAQDKSNDRSYIEHALDWLDNHEGVMPDLIAILRPTTPLRDPLLLGEATAKLTYHFHEATSLRSVHALPEPPQKMLQMQEEWLTGFFPDDPRKEYFNLPRQFFPTAYQPNGYIDIVKSSFIRTEYEGIFGAKMVGFETPYSVEIDAEQEFKYLEFLMEQR